MENLHSRVMEMEKSKPDPNTTPMNQQAVNAFFAPRKKEPAVKGETSQSGYPTSSCSAGTPEPPPEMVMRIAMELPKSMGGGATMPGYPGPMPVKDR